MIKYIAERQRGAVSPAPHYACTSVIRKDSF